MLYVFSIVPWIFNIYIYILIIEETKKVKELALDDVLNKKPQQKVMKCIFTLEFRRMQDKYVLFSTFLLHI
jgi:hypothetical protein